MFSMFFGSGNLVFPVLMGTQTLDKAPFAAAGLFLTGVLVPFIGLISVIMYAGDRKRFFSCIGVWPAFFLTFVTLSLMGPFGVLPRCIIVAYGGIQLFMPDFSFKIFAVIFAVLTSLVIWKHDKIIPILGRVLTPFLIAGVGAIIFMGFFYGKPAEPTDLNALRSFSQGLLEGYQIMDLLAAFFFAATAVGYVSVHLTPSDSPKLLPKLSTYSSIIAMILLGLVYVAFVILGARYANDLQGIPAEQLLAAIAGYTMGEFAIPIISITIALACLTTATVLTMLWADFLSVDITKGRLPRHPAIIITLGIALLVSFQGFESIRGFLGTILQVAYPALITLALASIIKKWFSIRKNIAGWAFWGALAVSLGFYYL